MREMNLKLAKVSLSEESQNEIANAEQKLARFSAILHSRQQQLPSVFKGICMHQTHCLTREFMRVCVILIN